MKAGIVEIMINITTDHEICLFNQTQMNEHSKYRTLDL